MRHNEHRTPENTCTLMDNADHLPESETERAWKGTLHNLVDVVSTELKRQHIDDTTALSLARKIIAAQAFFMGGRAVYIPNGKALHSALRDHEIFTRWKHGENIEDLRREYGLSQSWIYSVIRHQRRINTRHTDF